MFNALQPWHIIVLVVVLIALFGAKRLPDAAKGIGKSMRIFKAETKAMRGDGEDEDGKATGKADKADKGTTAELPAAKVEQPVVKVEQPAVKVEQPASLTEPQPDEQTAGNTER